MNWSLNVFATVGLSSSLQFIKFNPLHKTPQRALFMNVHINKQKSLSQRAWPNALNAFYFHVNFTVVQSFTSTRSKTWEQINHCCESVCMKHSSPSGGLAENASGLWHFALRFPSGASTSQLGLWSEIWPPSINFHPIQIVIRHSVEGVHSALRFYAGYSMSCTRGTMLLILPFGPAS